jgi:hypothetical protein
VGKNLLIETLGAEPLIQKRIQPALDTARFLHEFGQGEPGFTTRVAEIIASCENLEQEETLALIVTLANECLIPATREERTAADHGCIEALLIACWLPQQHLLLLIRELAQYGLFQKSEA